MHPVDVDDRRLVILRQNGSRFDVIASGWLTYDGESLTLKAAGGDRTISVDELADFQPIIAANRIRECQGFDFFLLAE